jgi:hypothetical protein
MTIILRIKLFMTSDGLWLMIEKANKLFTVMNLERLLGLRVEAKNSWTTVASSARFAFLLLYNISQRNLLKIFKVFLSEILISLGTSASKGQAITLVGDIFIVAAIHKVSVSGSV